MYTQKYWKLINKYLSNECTDEEIKEIENKKKHDKEFSKFFNEIMELIAISEKEPQVKNEDEKWNEIKADMLNLSANKIIKLENNFDRERQRNSKKHISQLIFRYAAIFLIAIGLPYLAYHSTKSYLDQKEAKKYRIIKVEHSERLAITLSDGTKITLDAGSELKIPENYDVDRNVYLNGEAYFQVAHDVSHQFRVFAKNALVRVVGTEFNVRAWKENPVVTVTVSKGKVLFSSSNETSRKVFLTKGKQSSLPKNGIPSEPIEVNVDEYTSWMNNELHFKNATLREILAQLERWYDYHFELDDSLLYNNRLTYHVKRTNVDNLLQSISILTNTIIEKKGKTIKLISKNKINKK